MPTARIWPRTGHGAMCIRQAGQGVEHSGALCLRVHLADRASWSAALREATEVGLEGVKNLVDSSQRRLALSRRSSLALASKRLAADV